MPGNCRIPFNQNGQITTMSRIIIHSLMLVLCAEACAALFADVAPPVYPGYSLSPFDANNLRMRSEKIDLYYGSTCTIEAVFEIWNPAKKIVGNRIGFPFNPLAFTPRGRDTSKIYDFVMSLNGEDLLDTDAPHGSEIRSDKNYWYGWTCAFKPKRNIVKLTYHVLTTSGESGYRWEKTLNYVLNSDRNWPGTIENVQVTVHFPASIAQRQVLAETSPPGYEIKEKEIVWRFTSFTPRPESNIVLHLIDFKFFADMLNHEKVLSAPDATNAAKLDAARFFASLAPFKGINISAPTMFKRSYYDTIVLPNLKSAERTLFKSTYKLHKGSGFEDYYSIDDHENFYRNDPLRRSVLDVMNRIGYFEKIEYPVIYKYIEGAKRLFNEVVTGEPKNAAAWIAFIDNYYLIETGACSPCVPWSIKCDCPESQKELVREAYRHCGNDSTIAAWNSFLFPARAPLPDTLELERSENPRNITIKIKHENLSWSDRLLSPDELGLVKKAYTMSGDVYFVLKNTHLDENTQKKLADILGGCALYRYKFCRDLEKLHRRGK
jgi:hypothetical protein